MTNNYKNNETITFNINEIEQEELEEKGENKDIDFFYFLNEIESNEDINISKMIHYSENCTLKDLYLICEYYGFLKDIKSNKCNKELVIQILVDFECNPVNISIVTKRQNLWFYINELKNDKFMKKYVLW
jgi:hypothetical protein